MDTTGLLTYHNGTQDDEVKPSPGGVAWYEYGNLGRVERAMMVNVCVACGKRFRVQLTRANKILLCHSCRDINVTCPACGAEFITTRAMMRESVCPSCGASMAGRGKRGEVNGLSSASRKRLMRKLSSVDVRHYMSFVTLTFPNLEEDKRTSPEYWRQCLRRFEARFRRRYAGAVFVWRLELIQRKSGEDAGHIYPHYHCLVLGVSAYQLRGWVSQAWYESVGSGDERHLRAGTNVKRVKSKSGVIKYASKSMGQAISAELGKLAQALPQAVGRWWGIACQWNKSGQNFFERFISPITRLALQDEQAARLLFRFRKMIDAPQLPYTAFTVFIGDKLMKLILQEQCSIQVE